MLNEVNEFVKNYNKNTNCYGFVIDCAKHFNNLEIPNINCLDDNNNIKIESTINNYEKLFKKIQFPKFGAFVLLRLNGIYTSHIGFCINEFYFLHKFNDRIEISKFSNYKTRIKGFYEYRNS